MIAQNENNSTVKIFQITVLEIRDFGRESPRYSPLPNLITPTREYLEGLQVLPSAKFNYSHKGILRGVTGGEAVADQKGVEL